MVHFQNVSRVYNTGLEKIVAVEDVSFKIDPGEFVFLIGPSGSGKTTIIKMLIRDERPSGGKIYFDDRDITQISRRNVYKLRREIGVIFQDYKLVPEKTAYENVAFAMEAAGKKDKEIMDTVPYVLDIVGLSHRTHSFPKELSGGEQQRVAIARAIANNPKILIADEPTGNLDPASSWDIVQILSKINNWGTTVIMSTHGTDIVNSMSKRVIQMQNGTIIRDDSKGKYEMVSNFEESVIESKEEEKQDEEEKDKEKTKGKSKKIFKVNITETNEKATEKEQKKEKRSFKLNIFPKKSSEKDDQEEVNNVEIEEKVEESDTTTPIPQQKLHVDLSSEKVENESEASNEKNIVEEKVTKTKKKKNKPKEKEDKGVDEDEKYMEDFLSEVKLEDLNLGKKTIAKLKKLDIKTVSDLINIGPENLEDDLKLSSKEVLAIASAIEEQLEIKK